MGQDFSTRFNDGFLSPRARDRARADRAAIARAGEGVEGVGLGLRDCPAEFGPNACDGALRNLVTRYGIYSDTGFHMHQHSLAVEIAESGDKKLNCRYSIIMDIMHGKDPSKDEYLPEPYKGPLQQALKAAHSNEWSKDSPRYRRNTGTLFPDRPHPDDFVTRVKIARQVLEKVDQKLKKEGKITEGKKKEGKK